MKDPATTLHFSRPHNVSRIDLDMRLFKSQH